MVTLIVAALAAGMVAGAKDTAATAVKDAYAALKGLLSRKYATVSVAGLEQKPGSGTQRAALQESLEDAGAGSDQDLAQLARQLVAAIRESDPEAGKAVGVILTDIEAGFIQIDRVESTGDGVHVTRAKTEGGVVVSNIKAGGGEDRQDP
jgi:hypothetical protein